MKDLIKSILQDCKSWENFIAKRYWLHLAFFFFLGYIAIYWADFKDFSFIDKIVGAISLTIAVGVCLGGGVEWMQTKLVKMFYPNVDTFDWYDIIWSAIGVSLACVVYYIYQNETLRLICVISFVTATVCELTRMAIFFGREYLKRRK